MGNPHPTKCKPCKIGRKHTNAKSLRHIGRIKSKAAKVAKLKTIEYRKYKKAVRAFWMGKADVFPSKPTKKNTTIIL